MGGKCFDCEKHGCDGCESDYINEPIYTLGEITDPNFYRVNAVLTDEPIPIAEIPETRNIIKEAKEILEGVTPGPWTAITPEGYDGFAYIQFNSNSDYDSHVTVYGIDESHPYCEQNRADLAFIFRARTLVPELVELCERYEAALAMVPAVISMKSPAELKEYEANNG